LRQDSEAEGTQRCAGLDGVRDDDTRLPSEQFKETVILAERAVEAGLTRDARFPMMKNQSLISLFLFTLCASLTLSVFPA
jgi:hypothetical protein